MRFQSRSGWQSSQWLGLDICQGRSPSRHRSWTAIYSTSEALATVYLSRSFLTLHKLQKHNLAMAQAILQSAIGSELQTHLPEQID